MSGSVRITTTVRFTDADGTERQPISSDKTITVDGSYIDTGAVAIAAGATLTLFDLSGSAYPISDFDALMIVVEECEDGKVMLELETDTGGTIRSNSLCLANDVPLILGADDSYNGTSGSFAGTLRVIKKAVVKNTSSGTAARLHVFAAT